MEKRRERGAEEAPARREEQVDLPVVERHGSALLRDLGVARSVEPDDEKANHPARYIGTGLLSLLFVALAIALLVLPPAFAAGFILRGRGIARPIGFALLGAWFVGLLWTGRRLMGARPPSSS